MTKTKHHDRKAAPPGEAVRAADVDESSSNARADAPTPTTRIHAAPDLRALTPDEALARAMEFATLAAVYLPARAVRKNPKNPRIHGDEVVNLARSIVRTAWGAPILVQASAMKIIGGHGRIESAHLILDGIEVDGVLRGGPQHIFRRYAPPGCIPVCVIDVDDATADAMTLADNAKRLQGRDDPSALVAMATASFARNAPTMLDLGLGADDLDALIRQAGDAVLATANASGGDTPHDGDDTPRERIEVTEDEAPVDRAEELRVKWGTVAGQLWEIPSATVAGGVHRILCGDCRKPDDVARLLDGRKVNVAFTSPPYAAQREYDKASGFTPIPADEYVAWFEPVQANVRAHLADDGSWFVNIKEHCEDGQRVLYVKDLTLAHARQWGWRFVDELCWTRAAVPGTWDNRFKNGWEPVFHFSPDRRIKFAPLAVGHESDDVYHYSADHRESDSGSGFLTNPGTGEVGIARPSNVLRVASGGTRTSTAHPGAFPVALPAFFLQAYSDPGDLAFDPFLGSATTIVAAEKTGRLGCGTELSPKYVAVCLERLATLGLTPRLVS